MKSFAKKPRRTTSRPLRHRIDGREGFALIITITLLAFLVLLLVSLTTLTRIETRVATSTQQLAQARQNALFALDLAIAELQKHTGPDQRTTARAEIDTNYQNENSGRHWTGVWETDTGDFRTWLVSPNVGLTAGQTGFVTPSDVPPQPTAFPATPATPANPNEPAIYLLYNVGFENGNPADRASRRVWMAKNQIEARNLPGMPETVPVGHFAYWVSDEGLKANLGSVDRTAEIGTGVHPQFLQQSILARHGGDAIWAVPDRVAANPGSGFPGANWDDPTLNLEAAGDPSIKRVFSTSVWRSQLSLADGGLPQNFQRNLKRRFHDFAVRTASPLTSTTLGGLRSDLSEGGSTGDPLLDLYIAFGLNHLPGEGEEDLQDDPDTDRIVYSIQLQQTDEIETAAAPLLTQGQVIVTVSMPNEAGEVTVHVRANAELWNPFNARLEFSRNLEARLDVTNWPSIAVEASDPTRVTGSSINLRRTLEEGNFIVERDGRQYLVFSGPQIVQRGGFVEASFDQESIRARDSAGQVVTLSAHPGPGEPTPVTLRLTSSQVNFEMDLPQFALRNGISEGLPESESEISEGESTAFAYVVGVQERLEGYGWIEAGGFLREPQETVVGGNLYVPHNSTLILLDLPRVPPLSIGDLQHVFVLGRPYVVGLPGSDQNNLFDNYYLSGTDWGVVEGFPRSVQLLPNSWLRFHRSTDSTVASFSEFRGIVPARRASHLLSLGSFNINSTSEYAWGSILAGAYFESWGYGGGAIDRFSNVHFRLPFSAHTHQTFFNPDTVDYTLAEFYANLGLRDLTRDELRRLAMNVVTRIKLRGSPFYSLQDFIDSGILEDAINDPSVGINTGFTTNNRNSLTYLTQQDMLSLLAPVLFARSDTFLIRAYGDVVNPLRPNRIIGRAWCEAIVQRIPDYVDPNLNEPHDVPTGNINERLGRRYVITAFRWLSREDI